MRHTSPLNWPVLLFVTLSPLAALGGAIWAKERIRGAPSNRAVPADTARSERPCDVSWFLRLVLGILACAGLAGGCSRDDVGAALESGRESVRVLRGGTGAAPEAVGRQIQTAMETDRPPYIAKNEPGDLLWTGTKHNIVNTSTTEPLKLYTGYSPPEHKDGTVRLSKAGALDHEEHFDGRTTE